MMIPPKLTHGDNLANLFEKFNRVIDYLREIRLVAGNGIRINRLPAGTIIESTATANDKTASALNVYQGEFLCKIETINEDKYVTCYDGNNPDSRWAGYTTSLQRIEKVSIPITASGEVYAVIGYNQFNLQFKTLSEPVINNDHVIWHEKIAEIVVEEENIQLKQIWKSGRIDDSWMNNAAWPDYPFIVNCSGSVNNLVLDIQRGFLFRFPNRRDDIPAQTFGNPSGINSVYLLYARSSNVARFLTPAGTCKLIRTGNTYGDYELVKIADIVNTTRGVNIYQYITNYISANRSGISQWPYFDFHYVSTVSESSSGNNITITENITGIIVDQYNSTDHKCGYFSVGSSVIYVPEKTFSIPSAGSSSLYVYAWLQYDTQTRSYTAGIDDYNNTPSGIYVYRVCLARLYHEGIFPEEEFENGEIEVKYRWQ